jgi:hypothetical protein
MEVEVMVVVAVAMFYKVMEEDVLCCVMGDEGGQRNISCCDRLRRCKGKGDECHSSRPSSEMD